MDRPPNILIVLSDDHAQWAVGCYGNRHVQTPTLDWLASTGVRMANAMTVTPVCSPARATFWSGRYPSQHGIHDYLGGDEARNRPWLEGQTLLAEHLHRAGYHCGLFGKWHCGRPEVPPPGFDTWFCSGRRTGPHRGEQTFIDGHGHTHTLRGYQTALITDQALRFLRDRNAERPFFAFVGPVATHSPWADHPPRLVHRYRDLPAQAIVQDEVYPHGRLAGESVHPTRHNPRQATAQYHAAVSEIDEQVGRLVDELDNQGELENTLIIYTADHGLCCGHHGVWGKGNGTRPLNMLEQSIRIPMLFGGWRGLFAGQVRGEMVHHADLFETLLEVAGARPSDHEPHSGTSFAPRLTRAAGGPWRSIHIGEYGNLRMARSATHKLIRRHPDGPHELFDLQADPSEKRNLIDEPGTSGIIAQLDSALERTFAPMDHLPTSGLRVHQRPAHNPVEAWRGEPQ